MFASFQLSCVYGPPRYGRAPAGGRGRFGRGGLERRRFRERRAGVGEEAFPWRCRVVEAAPPLVDEERWTFGGRRRENMVC